MQCGGAYREALGPKSTDLPLMLFTAFTTDISIWDISRENLILLHANSKGANQPAHVRSQISTFVICVTESTS